MPSLAPHLEAARIIVAPIRYGAGLKGKIIEALVRIDSDQDLWESIRQGGSPPSTSASCQGDSANPSTPFSPPCLSRRLQKPDLQLAEVRLQPVGPSTQRKRFTQHCIE